MNLNSIKAVIADDGLSSVIQRYSLMLADYIFEHKNEIKHLTYSAIAEIIKTNNAAELLEVVQYCSGASVRLLETRYELIIDDRSVYLPDEYIYAAAVEGVLIDPETGHEVENYKEHVYPYFVVSEELLVE